MEEPSNTSPVRHNSRNRRGQVGGLFLFFLLVGRSHGFVKRVTYPSFAPHRASKDTPRFVTITPTQLGLVPKELVKVAAPITTKSIAAFPMVMASLAFERGDVDVDVDGGLTSTLLALAASSFPITVTDKGIFEAEILNDFSHVALDLFTFFGSPSSVTVRLAAVVGRLLLMAADYLPDHVMLPEEFAFQLFMLGVAWVGLVRSTLPVALSNLASDSVSLRDGKAYIELFSPVGVTWAQFKALSVYALDWVDMKEGEDITSDETTRVANNTDRGDVNRQDEYVYWLYRGQAVVQSSGKEIHDIVRAKNGSNLTNASPAMGLLGELSWATNSKVSSSSSFSTETSSSSSYPGTTVKAGKGGATLLRIHKCNLAKLMKDDAELGHSIRDLMFQGIQDKLAAQLAMRV